MLSLEKSVLDTIQKDFSRFDWEERSFLLGCSHQLDHIDRIQPMPVKRAERFFVMPDSEKTDAAIAEWATRKICFCGMIHSHPNGKNELSQADKSFAEQLVHAYRLPVMWFGIGAVKHKTVEIEFYGLWQADNFLIKTEWSVE